MGDHDRACDGEQVMVDYPTASSMKMRFKQFRRFEDGEIEFAIEEAMAACLNGDWIDNNDRVLGVQLYAAHMLQMTLQRGLTGNGMMKTSESTPELSVSWSVPPWPSAEEITDYNQTMYGMRFRALKSRNFPAVLVVNSAVRM
jgi:hypothetical protein